MKQYMKLLGLTVVDKVTGTKGVVTSISFDLYGCVQAIVTQEGHTKDEKLRESYWFDVKRLTVKSKKPVMPVPAFEVVGGPAAKPAFATLPRR